MIKIKYDYVFSGMGLAGLMILHKMISSSLFAEKKILILEPDDKTSNDRTWCFWEKGVGKWDKLVRKEWEKAFFINQTEKTDCLTDDYCYKMIESKSFYEFIIQQISTQKNITWIHEKVVSVSESDGQVVVLTDTSNYFADYLFNSVFEVSKISSYPLLKQHFVGWYIKCTLPVFREDSATFMDFSVPQKGNTRFMYVLPLSEKEALVEYTLFSENVLKVSEYEEEIKNYLYKKNIVDFEIVFTENGNIPMTAYPFWKSNSKRILNIGMAGGWTKASSGYTFKNSDKNSDRVLDYLRMTTPDFRNFKKKNRFWFYDKIFVNVLIDDNSLGEEIFSRMFLKVKPNKILRFLDEESSVKEELQIIWACPKWPFIKALFK